MLVMLHHHPHKSAHADLLCIPLPQILHLPRPPDHSPAFRRYIVLTSRYFFFSCFTLVTHLNCLASIGFTMLKLLLTAALAAVGLCYTSPNATNSSSTYKNPVLDTVGADPYVNRFAVTFLPR